MFILWKRLSEELLSLKEKQHEAIDNHHAEVAESPGHDDHDEPKKENAPKHDEE